MPAPIALFVYNRPAHARRTLEALARNEKAAESDLIIFSDGAREPRALPDVAAVRDVCRQVDGFRSVSLVARERNLGLAGSITDGVTQLCASHGRVIVIEDDLVTSPYFLRYMNEGLERYAEEPAVISVQGYVFPMRATLPDTFFMRGADCWGWATWQRGWQLFDPDGARLRRALTAQGLIRRFNFDGAYDYLAMLDAQVAGRNDSWAVRWYASAFLAGKLSLYPGTSLVLNIGNDSSGTHGADTEAFAGPLATGPVMLGPIAVEEDEFARAAVVAYYRSQQRSLLRRAWTRIAGLARARQLPA